MLFFCLHCFSRSSYKGNEGSYRSEAKSFILGDYLRKKFPNLTIKYIQAKAGTTLPDLAVAGHNGNVATPDIRIVINSGNWEVLRIKLNGSYFSIALVFMLQTMVTFYGNMCLFFCIFQRIGGIGVLEIIEKVQFSVIGKLGKGFTNKAPQWIPPLWQEANSNSIKIINLAIHHHVQAAPVCFVKEPMHT
ncbi:hypothetical protein FE783_34510 [Paenibacillus mesophilus]|uniref:hypothetical protein n=1 Tax=Paenibacillus mesophilus TaxID=2582849 RepID=UPI00110DA9EF|nr:hypothetical protein [Paenibacillus mesophilus]TMV43754.1 hypothetical protein FE783_34510 [Paenibacillus mesophilus]